MPVLAVIGAHAMDAEVMGGAIALELSIKGWDTFLVHMTRGERGNKQKQPEEYGVQLEREMREAAAKLGSGCHWMGYQAGKIPTEEEGAQDVKELLNKLKPDVIITHWKGSYHPRHVQTYENVVKGVELAAGSGQSGGGPVTSLYFGENMEDQEGFIPNVYFDVTNTYQRWLEALESYEMFRESTSFPYRAFYTANSIARGIESGQKYSKALMLPKLITADLRQTMNFCYPRY